MNTLIWLHNLQCTFSTQEIEGCWIFFLMMVSWKLKYADHYRRTKPSRRRWKKQAWSVRDTCSRIDSWSQFAWLHFLEVLFQLVRSSMHQQFSLIGISLAGLPITKWLIKHSPNKSYLRKWCIVESKQKWIWNTIICQSNWMLVSVWGCRGLLEQVLLQLFYAISRLRRVETVLWFNISVFRVSCALEPWRMQTNQCGMMCLLHFLLELNQSSTDIFQNEYLLTFYIKMTLFERELYHLYHTVVS